MSNSVTGIAPASSTEAEAHFSKRLTFETDCWDVHHALTNGATDFVVLDVRGRDAYTSNTCGPRARRGFHAARGDR